jgi:hypothetical protein
MPYEICEKLLSGEYIWLATVESLPEAERLKTQLRVSTPQSDYVICVKNEKKYSAP